MFYKFQIDKVNKKLNIKFSLPTLYSKGSKRIGIAKTDSWTYLIYILYMFLSGS